MTHETTYRCTACDGLFSTEAKAWEKEPECPHCLRRREIAAIEQGIPDIVDHTTPGLKFDHAKPLVVKGVMHYFPRALIEVANLSQWGAEKYSWDGWESVPNGVERYREAIGRHLLGMKIDGPMDEETQMLHATAVAWNALATLELMLREK